MNGLFGLPFVLLVGLVVAKTDPKNNLVVVTVASNATDGYLRFLRSAEVYGYSSVEVLGMNEPWLGGDVKRYAGGGYKINLLKKYMEKRKDDTKTIYLFTDSYDVIFTASAKVLLKKYLEMKSRIVFTAERYCWPDATLANQYPPVMGSSKYLNSGGFIGTGQSIYEMLTVKEVADTDDDQLYYSQLYLNPDMRNDLGIKLDYENEIFQALFGSEGDVKIRFRDDDAYLVNVEHNTEPVVVHGNGHAKDTLNSMGNYLARSWIPGSSAGQGCLKCAEGTFELSKLPKFPLLQLGIFVEKPTPFLKEFFERIVAQDYPKEHIHVYLHNREAYHNQHVSDFLQQKDKYASIVLKGSEHGLSEAEARSQGAAECLSNSCDYYLSVDSEAMLTEPKTIRLLMELNRTLLAPMLIRPGKMWSNFWGALSEEGFYSRSEDYFELLDYSKQGIWNVPYVSTAYIVRADVLKNGGIPPYINEGMADIDVTWAKTMRDKGSFMYVSNLNYYGHLVNPDNYDPALIRPEYYQMVDNKLDWEYRYIHEDYAAAKDPDTIIQQPCPDVYWFPVTTPAYCNDTITIMEHFGQWSNGANNDQRLPGGYENVPTRDIHMKQVGLERQWMLFLKDYIRPIQEKLYTGYFHDPPHALMNFVVRYRPEEQPALRPHHDASTYTINLALNTPNVDYEGGGCRFIRYNCSVTDTRPGWTLIHPGRLTHFHEGLPVTKGTRYIMISFVDP